MKLSGIESCISSALISTKSPIVCSPRITAAPDITMQTVMPVVKMIVWPILSQESDVQMRTAASS
jgi:hypothetical protein